MAFYNELKDNAVKEFQNSVKRYNRKVEKVQRLSQRLFDARSKDCQRIVTLVEAYINELANTPKYFSREFALYKASYEAFDKVVQEFYAKEKSNKIKSGATAGAGILAGIGTATLAPTAAMAIATTFGTASTGAAIGTLTGAAAKSAALAWLGGGALTAGGGGIVAGKALLALAGPVGLAIGTTAIVGGGVIKAVGNKKVAAKANERRAQVEANTMSLSAAAREISEILDLTNHHIEGTETLLNNIQTQAPKDYEKFSESQKQQLGTVVNHIKALTMLMNRKARS